MNYTIDPMIAYNLVQAIDRQLSVASMHVTPGSFVVLSNLRNDLAQILQGGPSLQLTLYPEGLSNGKEAD